jgi:hypothetical protein
MVSFDPEQRMHELQTMHEQILKVSSDQLNTEHYPDLAKYDFSTFQAMDEVEDFFDEYTYKLETTGSNKTKVSAHSRRNRKKKGRGPVDKGTPLETQIHRE